MRLYQKLVLFMLAAAVGPVAVVGFSLLASAESELRARIGAQQAATAAAAAQQAGRDIDEGVETLVRAAGPIRWRELDPQERAGALRLLLQQSRHFSAAVLLDSSGAELLPAVLRPSKDEAHDGRPPQPPDLTAFRAAVPLAALANAGPGAVAMSPPYARPGEGSAAALAVAVDGAGQNWLAVVEMSLHALQERAEEESRTGAGELYLVDAEGRAIAGPSREVVLKPVSLADRALAGNAGSKPSFSRYAADGVATLGAVARTPDQLGWTALVRIPEEQAFAPVARMRRTVLFSIAGALLLLLAAGFLFSRGIATRLEQVAEGARAFGRGELSVRIEVKGADETAELAETFNAVGAELSAARKKLLTWNEELQQKVEERTAELKAAQAQLLEAQKLAAIGQLGAGVAHEINNPLAGILGNAQLLLLDRPGDDRESTILKKIEAQAKRAKEITSNLLRFSQQRPAADLRPVDLNKVVKDTLSLVEAQVKSEGIEIGLSLADPLPPVSGDPGHLAQVMLHLLANARTAMLKSSPKRLTLGTLAEGDTVSMWVADTGKGIADKDLPRIFEPFFTTKDVWSNVGLGLSVSYRVVSEHKGQIKVKTEVGKGSTFSVELPKRG